MKKGISLMLKASIVLALVASLTINAVAASLPRMTKEQLKSRLDDPELIIVDVRTGKDWKASEYKIKGAVRVNPREVESWAGQQSEKKTFVFYCA
jgi:rhodanese-related sulfurtransferase